jgi:hypothetical protein
VKKTEASSSEGKSEAQRERDNERLWEMVEQCRQETKQSSRQEACPFCENIFTDWKKLTVHLRNHLEQLTMPILELAKQSGASFGTHLYPTDAASGYGARK